MSCRPQVVLNQSRWVGPRIVYLTQLHCTLKCVYLCELMEKNSYFYELVLALTAVNEIRYGQSTSTHWPVSR